MQMPPSQGTALVPSVNTELSSQCHKYSKSEGRDLLKRLGNGPVALFAFGVALGIAVIVSFVWRGSPTFTPVPREDTENVSIPERFIIMGASYDSPQRSKAARCHQTSCAPIIHQLDAWSSQPISTTQPQIFWLRGSGGIGKSTVAQTIAEQWDKQEQGKLAASLFFSGMTPGLDRTAFTISTIASQVARRLPGYTEYVNPIINDDPDLFIKPLAEQAESLITTPLTSISLDGPPKIIVLDGLDEIINPLEQVALLDVLGTAIIDHQLPLRLLIASRPEKHIFAALSQAPFNSSTVQQLDLDVHTKRDYLNVEGLLQSGFASLKESPQYPWLADNPSWPSPQAVSALAKMSQGSFAFSDVLMEHLNVMGGNPRLVLDSLMKQSQSKEQSQVKGKEKDRVTPATVDGLYTHILSSLPAQTRDVVADVSSHWITQIAGVALQGGGQVGSVLPRLPSMGDFSNLLLKDASELQWYLQTVNSLVHISSPSPPSTQELGVPIANDPQVRPAHRMFLDFLVDVTRSGDLHLGVEQAHARLAFSYLKHITLHLSGSTQLPSSFPAFPHEDVQEALRQHLSRAAPDEELRDGLLALIGGGEKNYRKFIESERVDMGYLGYKRAVSLFEALPCLAMREVVWYLQRCNDLRDASWSRTFTNIRLKMYSALLYRWFWGLLFPGGFIEPLARWILVA